MQARASEDALKNQLQEKTADRLDLNKKLLSKDLEKQERDKELGRLREMKQEVELELKGKSMKLERAEEKMAEMVGNSQELGEEFLRKIAGLERELGVVMEEKASLVQENTKLCQQLEGKESRAAEPQSEWRCWEV